MTHRIILAVGCGMTLLAAFGVGGGAPVNLFEIGVTVCFGAFLVRPLTP